MYGGDDVSALVVDAGTHHFRAGYSGEDAPKMVTRTVAGILELEAKKEIYVDDLIKKREKMIIQQILDKDGYIADYESFDKLM